MKKIFTLIFCLSALSIYAQKIENFKIDQNEGELALHFDITGSQEDVFNLSVFYSVDQENWKEIEKVYGDVGDSIKAGKEKTAVLWVDHLENLNEQLYFKVTAEFYTIETEKSGKLKDNKGVEYHWIRVGKNKWMTQNLKKEATDDQCGGFFTNSAARNACPDGWHLPSDEEWMALETNFGVDKQKVKEHGLREINLNQMRNAGFDVNQCKYNVSLYPDQKALAFWTSTENKMLYTGYSQKYFARIIRLDENQISKELRDKSEELNVRCVQSSIYLAKIEAVQEVKIKLNPVSGKTNHPFTGDVMEWIYMGDAIWLKDDLTGSYLYKEASDKCPVGWRLPVREEWESLLKAYKPSIDVENEDKVLSERLRAEGIWSFNISNNDYWMDIGYYTYNTYWINENDKADSRKLREFLSTKRGITEWVDKQTNEKGKIRCLLDDNNFINEMKNIQSGTFVDSRDNKQYSFVDLDGTVWMSENLKYDMGENSVCRNNIQSNCELFGHMYNLEVMESGCPDGWRIPTQDEWKYLLINKAANKLQILYPFGGSGFNLLLGGEMIHDEDMKEDVYTAKYLFKGEDRPGFYYIDSQGKVEMDDKAKRRDYYYVRCVKE